MTLTDQERNSTEEPIFEVTKGVVRISEVKDVLRQDTALPLPSLHPSERDVTWVKDIMGLSSIFHERQTELYKGYVGKLHRVTEKATCYKRMTEFLDEIECSNGDKNHLARTQKLLHKHETKKAKIQSELPRIEKVVQG